MDRRQIASKLALDEIGQDLTLRPFSNRLILQKTIYLVQASGVHLGYSFTWYLRGPYSRELTADLFTAREELDGGADETSDWFLDEESTERIEQIRPLIEVPQGFGRSKADWLELLASVHFLIDTGQISCRESDRIDHMSKKLLDYNKNFTGNEIRMAYSSLETAHLL